MTSRASGSRRNRSRRKSISADTAYRPPWASSVVVQGGKYRRCGNHEWVHRRSTSKQPAPADTASCFFSMKPVKTHLGRLMSRLALSSRAQAVAMAYEAGLVVPAARA